MVTLFTKRKILASHACKLMYFYNIFVKRGAQILPNVFI